MFAVDDARLEAAVAIAEGDRRAGLCHIDRGRRQLREAAQLLAHRAGVSRAAAAQLHLASGHIQPCSSHLRHLLDITGTQLCLLILA